MFHLARTFRTIRHLRPSQWYWRLRYRWEGGRPAVAPRESASLAACGDFPAALLEAALPRADETTAAETWLSQMERGRFTHLNESRDLGADSVDWLLGPRRTDRLWTVTLHYHAWAWRLAKLVKDHGDGSLSRRADRLLRRLLGDWITRCDLSVQGSRPLAWNAYAIATRIGWWTRLYHLLGPSGRATWGTLDTVFRDSLWSQAAWLSDHLEWDLRANHLLRDAVGLAWAGRFFEAPRAKWWLQTATHLAADQAREQVLGDGGHFERSPMYHVEVMDDVLTLAALVENAAIRKQLENTWRRMADFLAWARHPDGRVPLLNDGGFNGACPPATELARGNPLLGMEVDPSPRTGGRLFADFGLAVWHGPSWSLFFDVGPVGPDEQPGHAHADTLAFEASYAGLRLFVDPGTLRYDDDASRRYDRATASHNTVTIDRTDSSEVWHIFRVGRRARPIDVEFETAADHMRAAGSHTGYDHLRGRPRHRRAVEIDANHDLTITDRFTGRGRHHVSVGLLIAPGWQVEPAENGWRLRGGGHSLRISLESPPTVRGDVEQAAYHPEYGLEQSTLRLVWRGDVEFPITMTVRVVPE